LTDLARPLVPAPRQQVGAATLRCEWSEPQLDNFCRCHPGVGSGGIRAQQRPHVTLGPTARSNNPKSTRVTSRIRSSATRQSESERHTHQSEPRCAGATEHCCSRRQDFICGNCSTAASTMFAWQLRLVALTNLATRQVHAGESTPPAQPPAASVSYQWLVPAPFCANRLCQSP
jgi:hypothetical protein